MEASTYSLAINLISVAILFIPFIGTGTLYNRTYSWKRFYKALSFRGWLLIILALSTVVLNHFKDRRVEDDEADKAKEAKNQIKMLNDANNKIINDNTFNVTTRVYKELIKSGKSQLEAQQIIQQTSEKNLTNEITKLKEIQVIPALIEFTFSSDSLTFGSEKLYINLIVSRSKIMKVKLDYNIAAYYNGSMAIIPLRGNFINIATPTIGSTNVTAVTNQLYLVDAYVFRISGIYFDLATNSSIKIDQFYKYNPKKKLSGPITDLEELSLSSFFKNKQPTKISIGVPGENFT